MDIAIRRAGPARLGLDYSFVGKAVLAAALVALADTFFFGQGVGSTLGAFSLALLIALLTVARGLRRSPAGMAAAGAALVFALALAWDPSLLALGLFWTAASLAVLLPRTARFDDARRWTSRILFHTVHACVSPFLDVAQLRRARRRRGATGIVRRLPLLVLPLAGSAVFLGLFAAANPLIGNAFQRVDLAVVLGTLSFARIAFWAAVLLPVWALFRPRLLHVPVRSIDDGPVGHLPGAGPVSVLLSLAAFNAVFALENGLDLAFLWSGAPLPDGMTLAEYAHRGAYPLILTALLAGLFVLVTLRPGTELAESALIRRLVYVWIGQNVLLVASTILRTLDYVDAYSLTRLRIAALIWMGLVAVGLVLLCWRIWRGRSGAWLINANAAAAALVLAACSFVDLGTVAADWNLRHAREAGGRGAALDLCYLVQLGPSALVPVAEAESRASDRSLRLRLGWTRNLLLDRLEPEQADWHLWTLANARRLSAARSLMAAQGLGRASAARAACGVLNPYL